MRLGKKLFLTITAAIIGMSLAFGQKSSGDFIDMVSAYSNGDFSGAKKMAEAILKDDPDNDAAWYYLGLNDLGLKDSKSAVEALSKAVSLDSTNFWYGQNLAAAYALDKNLDKAIEEYEKLLKKFPEKNDLNYNLLSLYAYKNQPDKVLDALDAIENAYGKSDQTVMYRFRVLGAEGKTDEAYQTLKDYTDEYSSTQALCMLADYALDKGQDSVAIAYFDEALALDKGYAPARLGKAEVYRMNGQYSKYFPVLKGIMGDAEIPVPAKADYFKAILQNDHKLWREPFLASMDTALNMAIACNPSDTTMINLAGAYYYSTQRPEKTLDVFKSWRDSAPQDTAAEVSYIRMLGTLDKWDEVEQESQKAFNQFKDNDFLSFKIWGQYNKNDYEGIIGTCRQILENSPDSTSTLEAYSTMGDTYHEIGNKAKAYKAYENALKINPDYAPVLNNYAYYLSMEGKKLKKAYAMSRKTIEQEPNNSTYLDTFGWILHLMGKDLEAKPMFKQAMIYGGKESSVVMEHYATVLEALGENDLAKTYRDLAKKKAAEEGNR
jgi:tetratricopeptide (TPR) repeat protein